MGSNGLLGQKVAETLVRGTSAVITLSSLEDGPVRVLEPAEYVKADLTSKKDVKNLARARRARCHRQLCSDHQCRCV
jgi:nucleoside-diphosphate-sugar epimerase